MFRQPLLHVRSTLRQSLARSSRQTFPHVRNFDFVSKRGFAMAQKVVNPNESVEQVLSLFKRQGNSDYIGEPVSSEEHALQAAYMGRRAGFGDDAVLAALLHDVGHLLGLDDPNAARMDHCGVVDHENIGGDWVRSLGFSERVSTLVRRHVDAKRYLCCVKPDYHDGLSDASKTTLIHQGGPMTAEEAKAFEKDELFKTILAMRHWDEAAKVPGKKVPTLSDYKEMMEKHIAQAA